MQANRQKKSDPAVCGAHRGKSPLLLLTILVLVVSSSLLSVGCAVTALEGLPELPPPLRSLLFAILTGTLPDGFSQSSYSAFIETTGGVNPMSNCVISSGSLPGGLGIIPAPHPLPVPPGVNPSGCLISGTITTPVPGPGTVSFTFTVTVDDNSFPRLSDTKTYTIVVRPGFSIVAFMFGNGTEQPPARAFTQVIMTTLSPTLGNPPLQPDPNGCQATGLPAGLAIMRNSPNMNECIITGTPAAGSAGTYNVTIMARDTGTPGNPAGNLATFGPVQLIINPPLAMAAFALAAGKVGVPFGPVTVTTTGGQTPITCADAATLPPGLGVAPDPAGRNCVISGTPTATAMTTVTISATDSPTSTTPTTATVSQMAGVTINAPPSLTTIQVVDGVQTRDYTASLATAGGNTPLTACTISAGGLPAGLGIQIDPANNTRCQIFTTTPGTGITAAPMNYGYTVQITDSATATTPATSATQAYMHTVRAEYANTQAALVDGVAMRTYGNAPLIQPETTNVLAAAGANDFNQPEIGNGPLTTCMLTAVAPATITLTALVNPAAQNQCRLESVGALAVSGPFTVTVATTDSSIIDPVTGLVAVAPRTISSTLPLTVQAVLMATLTQAGNAASPNPAALLDGALNRSYGVGGTPTYSAAGGLSPSYGWCISAGAVPAGFTGISTCPTLTPGAVVTLSASPVGASGLFNFTVQLHDGGNTAVPSSSATGMFDSRTTDVNINGLLALAANLADPLPSSVLGRVYGNAPQTPVVYTASGGMGGYTFSTPPSSAVPAAAFPATISCMAAPPTFTCASVGAVTAAAGTYPAIPVTADDTGNAATPGSAAAGASVTVNRTVDVLAPLSVAVNFANPLPDAAIARTYGNAPQTPVIYMASGGLGGYIFSGGAFPATIACTPAATTFTCASVGAVTAAAGFYPATGVTLDDTGNATTPSGSASGTTFTVNRDLTIQAALTFTTNVGPQGGVMNMASAAVTNPDGVEARPYGPSALDLTRVPVTYVAAGGLGGFAFTLPVQALPLPYACAVVAVDTISCSTAGGSIALATAGSYPYTVAVTDGAGNATTPGLMITLSATLDVRLPLSNTVAPSVPAPDAAQSRSYGIAPQTPLSYTVTAGTGLGGYLFGPSGFPATFSCVTAANVLTCSSANVTDAAMLYSTAVNIDDTANATTPNNQLVSPFNVMVNLTVQPTLTVVLAQGGNPASPNPASLLLGVDARSYSGGGAPTYTASGGLGAFNWCVSAGGATLTGLTFLLNGGAVNTCPATIAAGSVTLTSAGVTGSVPAGFTITVDLTDGGNVSVPNAAATNSTILAINGSLAFGLNLDPPPVGVDGRSYGDTAAGKTPLIFTATAGTGLGGYTWAQGGALPTNVSCSPIGPVSATLTCTSGAVAIVGAGAFTFTATLSDTANSAVPSGSVMIDSATHLDHTINVNAVLVADLTQNAVMNPAALLDGAIARSYGFGLQAPAGTPTYTSSGGTGAGTYRWCVNTGAASLPTNLVGISTSCPVPTAADTVTLSASAATPIGAPSGPFAFTVELRDIGNVSVPASTPAPGTSATNSTTITIVDALVNTLTQAGNAASPNPASLLVGVDGRSYGFIGGTPTHTPTGGLGATNWCISAGAATLAARGFTIVPALPACPATVAVAAVTYSSAAGVTGPNAAFGITIELSDGGNAAVPNTSAANSTSLAIDAALLATLAQTGNPASPNPASLLDAVDGRTYGVIGGTPTYTAAGGTGPGTYTWCISAGAASLATENFTTTPAISAVCGAATLTDSVTVATPALGVVTKTVPFFSYDLTLHDTGNSAVPDAFSTATGSVRSTMITLLDVLNLVPFALANGTEGRMFGPAGAMVAFTGGIAPVACSIVSAPATGLVTAAVGSNCEISGTPTANGLAFTIDLTATDAGNAAVPIGSDMETASLDINAPLTIVTLSPIPNGVNGRTYTFTFSNTGGQTPFTWSNPTGTGVTLNTADTDCSGLALNAAGTTIGTSTPVVVNGVCAFNVTVTDTATATTLAGAVTVSFSLPINAPLTITTMTLPNGLNSTTYSQMVVATGGIGTPSWVGPGGLGAVCPVPTGTLPSSLAFSFVGLTATVAGTFDTPSATTDDFTFQVCVEDTGSPEVPAGFALPPVNNSPAASGPPDVDYLINVMATKAFVAAPGTDTIEVFNTSSATAAVAIAIPGTNPNPEGVAVTPNGRKLFVTLNGTPGGGGNRFIVFDTITHATVAGPTLFSSCTGPRGIVIGDSGAAANRAYVACTNDEVAVVNTVTNAEIISAVAPISPITAVGGAPDSIAVTPDGSRVYVTRQDRDVDVINTTTHVVTNLSNLAAAAGDLRGIAITTDGNRAYMADLGNDDVLVLDTNSVSGTFHTIQATILPAAAEACTTDPEQVAITPDSTRVYVTCIGSGQFVVIADSATFASIAAIAGSPFARAGGPYGITIPPIDAAVFPGVAFRVFIGLNTTHEVAAIDNTTPPALNTTIFVTNPFSLSTGGTSPRRLAHVPIPK